MVCGGLAKKLLELLDIRAGNVIDIALGSLGSERGLVIAKVGRRTGQNFHNKRWIRRLAGTVAHFPVLLCVYIDLAFLVFLLHLRQNFRWIFLSKVRVEMCKADTHTGRFGEEVWRIGRCVSMGKQKMHRIILAHCSTVKPMLVTIISHHF